MCFINSISSGERRIDSISRRWGEKASFEGGLISRLSMAVLLQQRR